MKKPIFIAVFLLIAVSVAMADTLNLTNLPGFAFGGYYVGPATGNLNGGLSFTLVCNDFMHTTYIPSSFDVNVSTIPELQHAMYANNPPPPSAIQIATYEQAAILMAQMGQPANQTNDGIGGIQFAIWNLFNPAAVPDPGTSPAWVMWVQAQDLSAWDYSGVRIYTPSDSPNQEFISGAASVPEPATMALIGFGLLGLGVFRRLKLWRQ